MFRKLLGAASAALASVVAWMAQGKEDLKSWREVAAGVYRAPGLVAGYAIVDGDRALLIDAPLPLEQVKLPGGAKVAEVWLTHPSRFVAAGVASALAARLPVRVPAKANEWLDKEAVAKHWRESLPMRSSRTGYFVVPVGFDGIRADLKPGDTRTWGSWTIAVHDAAGASRTQVALLALQKGGKKVLFVGSAFAGPGKLFAPFTTDWDHWTNAGLAPTAKTLKQLAELGADLVCPTHGEAIDRDIKTNLLKTAAAVGEAGFLKSFERFTKQRLGNPPQYAFLAREQAESNGSKPWTQVSPSLYLTGNTFVLVSKDGPSLMVDPWGLRSVEQWAKLKKDKNLGPLEVVWFSHAHYDHYDGVYDLPAPQQFETWALDRVAPPLEKPFRWRAPFLDPRPTRIDKRPGDGDTLAWREFRFRFSHLPGQSLYTMGVEATIDGKRCYFTADNFFHQDMFAGTGGWMGLNRAFPPYYAASAKKVLDAAPDWVLAEHGGPFEFNAEDWRRRVAWAEAAGRALDELSLSGNHLHDYNPHHLHIEPLVTKAQAGSEFELTLVGENALVRPLRYSVKIEGRGIITDRVFTHDVAAGQTRAHAFRLKLPQTLAAGRHVFAVNAREAERMCPADAFFVVDVESPR